MYLKVGILVGAVLTLAACDQRLFETAPQTYDVAEGKITCQHYTEGQVLWDRAIARPESLSDEEANNFCRAKGEELRVQPGIQIR